MDKAANLPASFWFKVVGGILAFLLAVVVLRKVLEVNKYLLAGIVFVGVFVVGFSWIYHRNEPAFLTPFVDQIAPFFPSKDGYEIRQAEDPSAPKKPGANKSSTKPAKTPPR